MSCLKASITYRGDIRAFLKNVTRRIDVFCYTKTVLAARCSLVCSAHNSLAMLVNDSKLLFDGEKVLLV